MMKENEDGVVQLVVGEDSFALCTRSSVRRGEGQKKMEKEWCESDSGSGSGRGLHQFFGRKNKRKKERK